MMKKILYPGAFAGVIIADHMGKEYARRRIRNKRMKKNETEGDTFLRIELLENPGAAAGILSGQKEMITALSGAVITVVVNELLKETLSGPVSVRGVGLSMIAGGGISNLLDRLAKGSVTDYIRLPGLPGKTAGRLVFNLSDLAISAGALLCELSPRR